MDDNKIDQQVNFHIKKIKIILNNLKQEKKSEDDLIILHELKSYIKEYISTALRKQVYQKLSSTKHSEKFYIIKLAFIASYATAVTDIVPTSRTKKDEGIKTMDKYISEFIPKALKRGVQDAVIEKVERVQRQWIYAAFNNPGNNAENPGNISTPLPTAPINEEKNSETINNDMKNSETINIEDLKSYQNLEAHASRTYNHNKDELLHTFLNDVKGAFYANGISAESARRKLDHNYKLGNNHELIKIDDDSQNSEVTLKSHTSFISKMLIRFGCCCNTRSKTEKLIDDLAHEMDEKFNLRNH